MHPSPPNVADRHEPGAATPPSPRLVSLDVFRGAAIAAMILVNNPGDGPSSYPFLKHADWNGWTLADLVFPFFIFIVGVSAAFSFRSRQERGESRTQVLRHVFWRVVILFVIGLFLNGFPNQYALSSWRVYGILQRIALCYLAIAVCALFSGRRVWIAAAFVCLAGYWILMRYVPVPGFGLPLRDIPLLDPDRNLAAWLDRRLLAGHLFDRTRDPEGLLSTLPAIATCILGLIAGDWLRGSRRVAATAVVMVVSGVTCIATGELWSAWFPINKQLWTSSFALLSAGLALLCLAACYLVVDVKHWQGPAATFFLVLGRNAIGAYVLAEVFANLLFRISTSSGNSLQDAVYSGVFEPLAYPANASLLYALCYLLVCWLVMWLLYRRRIFVKI